MKISRIVSVCLALFVLCLSISLVYALLSNFTIVIAYGVIVLFVSFGILHWNTCKCPLLEDECCFKLLFNVVVIFVSAAVIICICAAIYALVLMYVSTESSESIFYRVLDYVQILCLPLFFVVMEASVVMVLKDAKTCPKML